MMTERIVVRATYIWPDGQRPTSKLRNKEKPLYVKIQLWEQWRKLMNAAIQKRWANPFTNTTYGEVPAWVPSWGHDGSSTYQASTDDSDRNLIPVYVIPDPILGDPHILVLCEVVYPDGKVHESNTRAVLRSTLEKYKLSEPFFGFEQEYTLFDKEGVWPYRWPMSGGYPKPQGQSYCGIGSDEVFGRKLVDLHTDDVLRKGLRLDGTNAEVMASQWEFQVGPLPALAAADELLLMRQIIYRRSEEVEVTVKLSPKPIIGDWNGAGCHSNFSTNTMRNKGGLKVIDAACEKLKHFHAEHIWVYGEDNFERLTGAHETCRIDTYKTGIAHRGCSVRIPAEVAKQKKGYLEDRRPAANVDPYMVATALIETICGGGFNHNMFSYFFNDDHPPSWRHNVIMRGLFGR